MRMRTIQIAALPGKLYLSRPGLEKVKNVETQQQKKAALHDYFRNSRMAHMPFPHTINNYEIILWHGFLKSAADFPEI